MALRFDHRISDEGEGKIRITHSIQLTGPLSGLLAPMIGLKGEAEVVKNIARMAERS